MEAKSQPHSASSYINRGVVYERLGQLDEAIADYTLAINLVEDYPLAYYNRAAAYQKQGDWKRADADLEAVKRLVGDDPESAFQPPA